MLRDAARYYAVLRRPARHGAPGDTAAAPRGACGVGGSPCRCCSVDEGGVGSSWQVARPAAAAYGARRGVRGARHGAGARDGARRRAARRAARRAGGSDVVVVPDAAVRTAVACGGAQRSVWSAARRRGAWHGAGARDGARRRAAGWRRRLARRAGGSDAVVVVTRGLGQQRQRQRQRQRQQQRVTGSLAMPKTAAAHWSGAENARLWLKSATKEEGGGWATGSCGKRLPTGARCTTCRLEAVWRRLAEADQQVHARRDQGRAGEARGATRSAAARQPRLAAQSKLCGACAEAAVRLPRAACRGLNKAIEL